MMHIAIVEDEAIVARRLERMVRNIIGTDTTIDIAPTVPLALDLLRNRTLDLLFLDLNLNGRDGFSLLEEAAAAKFQTVVVSAHQEQALRAFDYGVTDFVAKPWSEERLRLAIDRVARREPARAKTLVVRKGRELRSIGVASIAFVRGADDYSEIHLDDGTTHLHEKGLTALEALLPETFARVHRSYIVNVARVRALRGAELVLENDDVVPVGRRYREGVRARILPPESPASPVRP
jgi:two-component system, LytTR family, response regulator LytT